MTQKSEQASTNPFQNLMPNMANAALILPHMQAAIAKAVLHQQKEMLKFFNQRCDADLALVDRISKAEDIKEASEAYTEFVKNTAKSYVDEAKKEARSGSASMAEITKEMSSVVETAETKATAKAA